LFVKLGSAAVLMVAAFGVVVIGIPFITHTDIGPNSSNLDPVDSDGASGGRVNQLASVAGDNQTFYAASEWGGVYKSTDGGDTWSRLDKHLPTVMWDVAVDPSNTNIVYATSFYDGKINPLSGIEVSLDGGATWTHPATAAPPSGYGCSSSRKSEPSAFGIGIRPDASNNVFIGTNCGLAISTDSGANWSFVDPTPLDSANDVWDVLVQPGGPTGQGIVDICGDDGNFRSTDGGGTWTPGGLPSGQCSLSASPDESYVLFATVGTSIFESDDAGATWTGLPNPSPQGRIPFIKTNQRSDSGGMNLFDLWFGDVSLHRRSCVTPAVPALGGAIRCPSVPAGTDGVDNNGDGNIDEAAETWFGPFTRSVGAHDDAGDLEFDTQAANDACPMLFSSDGGVYRNTDLGADCQNPDWEQPTVTPHGLWVYGMAGANESGQTNEDLYFGCQDNGPFGATNAGAASPTWNNSDCCDVFDFAAESARAAYTMCCFGARATRLFLRGAGLVGGGEISTYPADGLLGGFQFPDIIDNFGDKKYVLLTTNCTPLATAFNGLDDDGDGFIDEADENNGCSNVNGGDGGMYITNDITAGPIVWTEMGNTTEEPPNGPGSGSMCAVQASVAGGVPTFYVEAGTCDAASQNQLWKFTGTNPAGTWTRVDTNLGGGGIGVFAVDPVNPNRLYASNIRNTGPRMVFSNNGGQTWSQDTDLDALMAGNGAFKYQTLRGPTDFTGFGGYPQPTLVAFDPDDSQILAAGGRDSGVFLSRNGGNTWFLVTDPIDSGNSGVPHLPRPYHAYFDHEPAGELNLYIGTQGRGVWRINIPPLPQVQIPGDVFFDDTCVGSSSVETLNVCNTGEVNLDVGEITSSDPQFSVTTPTGGYPVTISPDFCFPFQVTFAPTSVGPQSATLNIPTNDPAGLATTVLAFGNGAEPRIVTLLPNNGNFGDVCLDDFKDLPLTISNSGGCDLVVSNITSSSFEFQVAGTMTFPIVIGPGDSIEVPIRLAPSSLGVKAATITVFSNDPVNPAKAVAVSGKVPPGDIRVTGSNDFGDVCPGVLAEKSISVCNVGPCNLHVTAVMFDPPCPDFTLINNPFPATVSPDSCDQVVIRFTPTSLGPKSCTLKIFSDDPDTPVVTLVVTGNSPSPAIDVPPDQAFPPTVIQSVGSCQSAEPFPVSNTGTCDLTITNFLISTNPEEFSLSGLPSFPIILEPGHIAGEGDLDTVFAPDLLDRNRAGIVSVTYVSDPILNVTTTVNRNLCGEGVRTGARILVTAGGVPLAMVEQIKLTRINANRNKNLLDTVDNARNLPLVTVTPTAPCTPFQYHREYATVSNPIQLLPGSYEVTVTATVNGKRVRKTVGFDVNTCGFNPNILVSF
jgi:photosystem II stability/assembly factor-like uncharacterized protein